MVKPDETICAGEVDVVEAVMELTDGRGVDVAITATAAGIAQEQALQYAARRAGSASSAACPRTSRSSPCDSNLVHYRELTIVGANGSSPAHNKEALRADRDRRGAGRRPDHPPAAAGRGARRRSTSSRSGEGIKVTIEPHAQ